MKKYSKILLLTLVVNLFFIELSIAQSGLTACQGAEVSNWTNCLGSATSVNGNKYEGEFKDGKLNGQGTYISKDGAKHIGEFKYGYPNGQGTFTFANGDKYVGEFKDGKFNGQGTYTLASGDKYVGEFKDNLRHGQGTYTTANGTKYVGDFKDGRRNGQGIFTIADGTAYEGYYRDDFPNGQGTLTFTNSDKYVGEFKDGKYNGQGTHSLANGDKYVGEFKDGKYNGQGTLTFANGDKYVGEYKEGKWQGQGAYTFANGVKYVGEFKDDKYNGQGVFNFSNGDKYVGEFKDGKYNGQGVFNFSNGTKYVGEYKNDMPNGQGTLTFTNSDKYIGEFKDGKYNGQGTYYFLANNQFKGDIYIGEFKDGKRNGQGAYTNANGNKYVGEYKDDNANGQGTQTLANGDKYVGDFKDGKYNGQGTYLHLADDPLRGRQYVGDYKDGVRSGSGSLTLANGDKYVGEYKDGKYNGQGAYTFASGEKYVGEYKDDKPNGQGAYTFKSGENYVGEFKDGKYNGQGTLTFANGNKYIGEFKDSKRNGLGTLTFASGDKYVGEFKDDKFNGQGTYFHLADNAAKGSQYVGEYKDSVRSGRGSLTLPGGIKYVGEFLKNNYNGQGTQTLANGDKYVGEFKDGKYNGQGTYSHLADNPLRGRQYVGEFKDGKYNGQGTLTFNSQQPPQKGNWVDGNFVFLDNLNKEIEQKKVDEDKAQNLFKDKLNLADTKKALADLNNAEQLIKQDQVNQAILLLENAYKVIEQNIGVRSPEAIRANDALILCYFDQHRTNDAFLRIQRGSLAGASDLWKETYKLRLQKYGDKNESSIRGAVLMAWVTMQNQLSESKVLLFNTSKIATDSLDKDHKTALAAGLIRASYYLRVGENADAENEGKSIADIALKKYGEDDGYYFAGLRMLGTSLLKQKKIKEAIEVIKKYQQVSIKTTGEDSIQTNSVLGDLIIVLYASGEIQQAYELAEKNYAYNQKTYGTYSNNTIQSGEVLGSIYVASKQYDKAASLLQKVVVAYTDIYGESHQTTLSAKQALAQTYISQSRYGEALAIYEKLIPEIEKLRSESNFSSEERQEIFAKFLGVYRFYSLLLSSRNPKEGFRVSELSKARTLLESTAVRHANTLGVLEKNDLKKISAFEDRLIEVNKNISTFIDNKDLKLKFNIEKSSIVNEYSNYKSSLYKTNPKYERLSEVKILDSNAGSSVVPPDSVFISYLRVGNLFVIYVIDPVLGLISKTSQNTPGLDDKIEKYRSALAELNYDRLNNPGTKATETTKISEEYSILFGNTLIGPILQQIKGKKKIIISPDGPLAFLPFESFTVNGKLLIEDFDISYMQSLSMMGLLKERKAEYKKIQNRKDLFAMGGAVYSSPQSKSPKVGIQEVGMDRATKKLLASRGGEGVQDAFDMLQAKWEDLPGTEYEVKAVAEIFGKNNSLVLLKADANEQNLQNLNKKKELKSFKRLLFSTHGYLSSSQPALSSIVLSQNNKTSLADGYLTASEIPGYDLNSDLTVLSACETGLGKIVQGEGVLGIPFALYVAGNVDTVLTLWAIEDDSTAEFMKLFFSKLKKGMQEVEALSLTKREFISGKKYSQAAFWAPFVLYGY